MVNFGNFLIDADDNAFMVKEKYIVQEETSPFYGQEKTITYGYYGTLISAVRGLEKLLQRRSVRNKDMDIKELKQEIRAIHKDIFDKLDTEV